PIMMKNRPGYFMRSTKNKLEYFADKTKKKSGVLSETPSVAVGQKQFFARDQKIKKKFKTHPINNDSSDQGTYNVWQKYNDFIRRLYLEKPLKRPTGKQVTLKYLSKLAIVFFGALFTTLTFYFLIDPNGLYNSGLNGLLQAASKLIVGRGNVG
ncbi:32911_t:CDS:1, partial [Racocetra persica]